MSQIQPAGGRLLQSLQSHASPSTQSLFAGTPVAAPAQTTQLTTPANLTDTVPVTAGTAPLAEDEQHKLDVFEQVLQEVEQGFTDPVAIDATGQAVPDPQTIAASPQQTIVSALDPNAVYQPSEDSGLFAQAIPTAVDQAQAEWLQQQPQVGGSQKERFAGGTIAAPELPSDVQYVEMEKSPELPPEVESFIQHVEETAQSQPQEIVVATDIVPATPTLPNPPRIVKVLPITKAQEEVGLRKNTSFSLRWLVEYGHKLAKALVGQVVYREK